MSFNDLFDEVRRNPNWWNYYKMNLDTIRFDDQYTCSDFIEKFISSSGKSGDENQQKELFETIKELEINDSVRPIHIVNTFLLGIYLYHNNQLIKERIDDVTDSFGQDIKNLEKPERRFQYIWFLICLFHDLGYVVESESEISLLSSKNQDKIQDKIKAIKNNWLDEKPKDIPELYTKDIILKYLDYRLTHFGCIDHGIYAGVTLYHELCKIRRNKKNRDLTLNWDDNLEKIYNYAAWIISVHNIFYVQDGSNDAKTYKKYKLKSLIIKPEDYRISIDDYPMLYLFCLVDTIEPIKVFKDKNKLDNLYLSISEKELKVRSKIHCGCHDSYFSKVEDLKDWLTSVKKHDNQTLIIDLNH